MIGAATSCPHELEKAVKPKPIQREETVHAEQTFHPFADLESQSSERLQAAQE
jgi:hypothetical protein